jgi:Na+/H+-dicarboxylate symporter
MVGVIAIALVAGFAIKQVDSSAEPFLTIIILFSEVQFLIMKWVLFTSPTSLLFLMTCQLLEHTNVLTAKYLKPYLVTIMIIYGIQFCVVYPLLHINIAERDPSHLLCSKVILIVAGRPTESSLATLHLSLNI